MTALLLAGVMVLATLVAIGPATGATTPPSVTFSDVKVVNGAVDRGDFVQYLNVCSLEGSELAVVHEWEQTHGGSDADERLDLSLEVVEYQWDPTVMQWSGPTPVASLSDSYTYPKGGGSTHADSLSSVLALNGADHLYESAFTVRHHDGSSYTSEIVGHSYISNSCQGGNGPGGPAIPVQIGTGLACTTTGNGGNAGTSGTPTYSTGPIEFTWFFSSTNAPNCAIGNPNSAVLTCPSGHASNGLGGCADAEVWGSWAATAGVCHESPPLACYSGSGTGSASNSLIPIGAAELKVEVMGLADLDACGFTGTPDSCSMGPAGHNGVPGVGPTPSQPIRCASAYVDAVFAVGLPVHVQRHSFCTYTS